MSQQNLWGACAQSCLLRPGPGPNSWHLALILALGNHRGVSPPSPDGSPLHLQFTPTVAPGSCFPPETNLDVTIHQVHLPQHQRFGLNSDLLRRPQKVVRLWVGCKAEGVPKSTAMETGSLSNVLESPRAYKWAVQCRGCDKITSIKITANSPWFLPRPLRSQSSPSPLPLPGSCLHTPCTHNLWQTGPHKPPARLAIGYYL